jgi:hypothetical protein
MKMKTALKASIMGIAFFCLASVLRAAPPGDPGDDPDPGQSVPFDFGISVMVAAGIGYAAKKRHDARKKEEEATLENK